MGNKGVGTEGAKQKLPMRETVWPPRAQRGKTAGSPPRRSLVNAVDRPLLCMLVRQVSKQRKWRMVKQCLRNAACKGRCSHCFRADCSSLTIKKLSEKVVGASYPTGPCLCCCSGYSAHVFRVCELCVCRQSRGALYLVCCCHDASLGKEGADE